MNILYVETRSLYSNLLLIHLYTVKITNYATILKSKEGQSGCKKITIDGVPLPPLKIAKNYAYGWLKRESGIHRLVRISPFDSNKRRHTSFASVWIYPEIDDKIEVLINDSDLKIDTYRASGAGGQHVNTTDSAVRITHIPSGVVAQCQDEKSQHKNKAKALTVLRSRIFENERLKKESERALERKSQVGSGDRSERIRTYNFPQGRVTDHRISLTLYKLEQILNGEALYEIMSALKTDDNMKKLSLEE